MSSLFSCRRAAVADGEHVGHLAVVVFPGQLIELARKSLCFLLQVLSAHLITLAARAALPLLLRWLKADGWRLVHLQWAAEPYSASSRTP